MATEKEIKQVEPVYSNAIAAAQMAEKPTYAGTFEGQLNDIYNKIANREKFSYNVNEDPLYQSYKDQYIQGGKLAMKDTMGQAAALTGGYGNTYGQQVGQQAYNAYLQNLSAIIPELYDRAYGQYKDEGDQLNNLYALAGQQQALEYGRYRDELGDWERGQERGLENERYEREWGRQAEQEQYNRQQTAEEIARQLEVQDYNRRIYDEEVARQQEQMIYNRERDEEETEYNRRKYAEEMAYKQEQDRLNRDLKEREFAAKLAAEEWEHDFAERQLLEQMRAREATNAAASYGGGGGYYSGGGGNSGGGSASWAPSYTTADIVAGNSNAIAAAAAGFNIANTSGNSATERQIVDAIDFATNRANAGSYAYKPNKNARNY